MAIVNIVLLVLHVSAAAVSMGSGIGIPRLLRGARKAGDDAWKLALEDAGKRGGRAFGSLIGTGLLGLALMFSAYGGFGGAPKFFHMALGVWLLAVIFGGAVAMPAGKKLAAATEEADIEAGIKRMGMTSGVMQLFWLIMLVMMFLPRLP